MPQYSELNPDLLVATVEKLVRRVGERFPNAGLLRVAEHLNEIAVESKQRVTETSRRSVWVMVLIGLLVALLVAGIAMSVSLLKIQLAPGTMTWMDLVQTVEAGINDVVLIGLGIYFLGSLGERIRRRRILRALHELRSLAHVIDMHQLTKDPQRASGVLVETESSPRESLSPIQLIRYLDYCSEMLSLVGKLAALYLQRSDDAVVLSTVDEIEGLTTGLSRKVWQKLMIMHAETK